MTIYSYVQENEDNNFVKSVTSGKMIDYQNFDCQNTIILNGKKMTVQEFKKLKGGL